MQKKIKSRGSVSYNLVKGKAKSSYRLIIKFTYAIAQRKAQAQILQKKRKGFHTIMLITITPICSCIQSYCYCNIIIKATHAYHTTPFMLNIIFFAHTISNNRHYDHCSDAYKALPNDFASKQMIEDQQWIVDRCALAKGNNVAKKRVGSRGALTATPSEYSALQQE